MVEAALSYCAAQVRRHDPDRFLTALFAPQTPRGDLFTLYAFNLEVAKTREVVSEALLGQIRLQWWRDAIAGIYDGAPVRAHEVATPLAELIARRGLSRAHFDRLIDGRERDLDDAPPATLAALEDYADATSSSLDLLALQALRVASPEAVAAARPVGIAWALTGLLRAVPFHAQRRRLYLPADMSSEAGLKPAELFERGRSSGLQRVVRQVAERAREHLAAARRIGSIPRAALPVLLPAKIADGYLGTLRRAGYDPFALDHKQKRPTKPLRLILASLMGSF